MSQKKPYPKKTFPDLITDHAAKNYELMELLKRTEAFKRFTSTKTLLTGGFPRTVGAFLETREGQEVFDRLRICEPQKSAISVSQEYNCLILHINLEFPKERIRKELDFKFEEALKKYHAGIIKKPRGPAILTKEEIDEMFRAYDLVEKHNGNFLHATWEMFPETAGKNPNYDDETKNKYDWVRSHYKKVKNRL